jgi:hypothetical protein
VHLFGGFTGGTVADYTNGDGGDFSERDLAANVSHIQGDKTDTVVTLLEAMTSTVDGFRITNGTRSRFPQFGYYGGGIYVNGGAPVIANNLIENNDNTLLSPAGVEYDMRGGGIFATSANISVLNNVIRNNKAGRGGGMAIEGGVVVIRGNVVQGNVSISDHGGGLFISANQAEITHNLILDNEIGRTEGYGWGGGIIVFGEQSFAHLAFNTVTQNYAPSVGGGIFIDDGATAHIDHELIYNNDCPDGGTTGGVGIYVDGNQDPVLSSKVTIDHVTVANHDCDTQGGTALYVEVHSFVTVTNSIFWDNKGTDFFVDQVFTASLTMSYSTSEDTFAGEGNLTSDPLFADPAQHDYHLQSKAGRWDPAASDGSGGFVTDAQDSPAIDAGDPTAPFAAEASPNGGRANMGAYGNTAEASKSSP